MSHVFTGENSFWPHTETVAEPSPSTECSALISRGWKLRWGVLRSEGRWSGSMLVLTG